MKKTILIVLLATLVGFLSFYPKDSSVKEVNEQTETSKTKTSTVPTPTSLSISEERFIELFKEICPNLLSERGVPISDVYRAMLAQYFDQNIDEEFVRKLLNQMSQETVIFDGEKFFGFNSPGVSDPEEKINLDSLKKETISTAFYLKNADWYSEDIFRKLTNQNKVRFALKITDDGYLFEALENMSAKDFLSICSDGMSTSRGWIQAGEAFYIPEENLRRISRIGEFKKSWTDHLGIKRTVNVVLDLGVTETVTAPIHILPNGKIMELNGELLCVNQSELFTRRMNGTFKEEYNGWSYIENGERVFQVKNNEVVFSKWGNIEFIGNAQAFEYKGQTVLEFIEKNGTTTFDDYSGNTHRTVSSNDSVRDQDGNPIFDRSDIACQWISLGRKIISRPNLNIYVSKDPFIVELARTICSWYTNEEDCKNGLLKFVQNLKYSVMNISGQAKCPKDSFLSAEADCEDATIFAMSLFSATGFKTGNVAANSVANRPGHAFPVVEGKPALFRNNGHGFTYAEATNPRFLVGDWNLEGLAPQYYFILGEKVPVLFQ